MTYQETLRGTGRTTRLIEHAKRLTNEGRAVYVIAASKSHAELLKRMSAGVAGLKIEYPAPDNFDWETFKLRGAHPNCIVLIDHFAIEHRLAPILNMLHAYDPPIAFEPAFKTPRDEK